MVTVMVMVGAIADVGGNTGGGHNGSGGNLIIIIATIVW